MKKIAVSGLMAIALCFCFIPFFSGCGETKYTYAEFQLAYQDYVEEYTGEIFDEDGFVDIQYKNPAFVNEINSTGYEHHMKMYTRLSNDTSSNQALFEPTLKASLLFVHNYITVETGVEVPVNASTDLYNSLQNLRSVTDSFVRDKYKFDTREGFNPDNALEQSWLSAMLDKYKDLVVTANNFSKQFIEVFNKYNTADEVDRADGRPALGSIDKFFLESLTSVADVYINVYLVNIYDKVGTTSVEIGNDGSSVIFGNAEMCTSFNSCMDINEALASYMSIADRIRSFENRNTPLTDAERAAISCFKNAKSYQAIFKNGYTMTLDAVSHYNFDKDFNDWTEEEKGYRKLAEDFFNCEYKNLTQMISNLADLIYVA